MPNKALIEEAIKQSTKSPAAIYRHGAVIFDHKNNIISRGFNHDYFHPSLKKYGYNGLSTHAEADAITKVDVEGKSLLVIRRSRGNTKLSNSMPCKHCMALIIASGISQVFYSNSEGIIKRIKI